MLKKGLCPTLEIHFLPPNKDVAGGAGRSDFFRAFIQKEDAILKPFTMLLMQFFSPFPFLFSFLSSKSSFFNYFLPSHHHSILRNAYP